MTVAPIAARAVAGRASAGKVIDVTPTRSTPLRNARPKGRGADVATGAGLGQLLDGMPGGGKSSRLAPKSSARKVLLAEFTLCMVVLAFSPVTDAKKTERPGAFMKRASATMGVFLILGLISTAGRGASRAAAAFGALMTLVLLISQRSIFTVLASKMAPGVGETPTTTEDAGEGVADIIQDIGEDLADGEISIPERPGVGAGIR